MSSAEIDKLIQYHQKSLRVLENLKQTRFDFLEAKRSIVTTDWNPFLSEYYQSRLNVFKKQIQRLKYMYDAITVN